MVAARSDSSAPAFADKIIGGPRTFIVTQSQADQFRDWAASLPGWKEGLFRFDEVSIEDVMRDVGFSQMKQEGRWN